MDLENKIRTFESIKLFFCIGEPRDYYKTIIALEITPDPQRAIISLLGLEFIFIC
jgi:hypothetical protein